MDYDLIRSRVLNPTAVHLVGVGLGAPSTDWSVTRRTSP